MGNQSRDRIAKLDLVIILAVGDKHEPGLKNFSPPADRISLGMERSFSKNGGESKSQSAVFQLCSGVDVSQPTEDKQS
jgi:hypothetical protein